MKQRFSPRFIADKPPVIPPREAVLYWFSVFGPAKRANLEDYWELTRESRETMEMAADRISISIRTAWRYEADIAAALEGLQ